MEQCLSVSNLVYNVYHTLSHAIRATGLLLHIWYKASLAHPHYKNPAALGFVMGYTTHLLFYNLLIADSPQALQNVKRGKE
jgi:hypothetical protein